MQEVSVYVEMCGDYCAFHEARLKVVYDITNDIQLDEYNGKTLEELEEFEYEGDSPDYQVFDAIKIGSIYYVDLNS